MIPEISIGEYGFKKILEDFKYTKNIVIITYNISTKNNELIKILKTIENKKIQLITNIPKRYEKYWSKDIKNDSKIKIKEYLEKLDPKHFKNNIEIYFNFKNHSKIYATDNYTYIGSQNFSEESKENYEVGIILENNIGLNIANEILENYSIRYYGLEAEKVKKQLKKIIQNIIEAIECIEKELLPDEFKEAKEFVGMVNAYFYIVVENLRKIERSIEELKVEIKHYEGEYNFIFFKIIKDALLDIENKVKIVRENLNKVKAEYDSALDIYNLLKNFSMGKKIEETKLNNRYNKAKKNYEKDIKNLYKEIKIILNNEEFKEILAQIPINEKLINNAE